MAVRKNTEIIQLTTPLAHVFRLNPGQIAALKKLGLKTVRDLLYHFPVRHGTASNRAFIAHLQPGTEVSIFGQVRGLKAKKAFRSKVPMTEGTIEDSTGSIKVIWLHQAYIAKLIQEGSLVKATGKVSERNGSLAMINPEVESIGALPMAIGESLFATSDESGADGPHGTTGVPVYNESRGVTSQWMYHALQRIFKSGILENIIDPIPADMLARYNLPSLKTALIWMHTPHKEADAVVARKRFAFEEIFLIQLKNERTRAIHGREKSFAIAPTKENVQKFVDRFGFPLTQAQHTSIDDIIKDFERGTPMSRLLEGDVGSGKTAVAATTAYAVVTTRPKGNKDFGNLQVAYMAPTEILARQHFESFIQYFKHMPISIGLITGNGCRKFPSKVNPGGWTDISRSQFLKWVANGEIAIVIGTHALIQKSVAFKHLAYVIIDEQHRFGTAQRQKLTRKSEIIPHLLSMTATPIPRTLALTLYGDLDLSILDQMPAGRKKVITEIIPETKRKEMYDLMHQELAAGRQAYVICPRIDDPDPEKEQALNTKSVKSEVKRLKKDVFPKARIEILHSKMKNYDKEEVMERFSRHEIDILVSTSVVEVGVNVPNSSLIVIEGSERFGLAQLHQLRGRVIRGTHQPYCFLCTSSGKLNTSGDRLRALVTAKNGFELSELDLQMRGAGELYAGKQWGLSDIAMEAIKNLKMVEAARKEARALITADIELRAFPLLRHAIETSEDIHFE